MAALDDSLSELFEETLIPLEREGHFRNKHAIGIAAGDGCRAGNKAGVAAHQLDKPDAISRTARFGMRRGDGIDGRGAGGFVSETLVHIGHIVVDGLGNTHHRQPVAAPQGFFPDGLPAALRAVAPDNEKIFTFNSMS